MIKEVEISKNTSVKNSFFHRFIRDEKGATAVEYGLLVGLISVVILATVTTLGTAISQKFDETQCKISGKTWTVATKTCA